MTTRSTSRLLSMLAATAILNPGCGEDSPFMGTDTVDIEDVGIFDSNELPDERSDSLRPDRDDIKPDVYIQPEVAFPETATPDHGTIDTSDDKAGVDTAAPNCDLDGITCIFLRHDSIQVQGPGASVSGTTVTIDTAGSYSISGTLDDGQILVDTADDGIVRLMLNGMSASSSTSSPLFIVSADDVEILLVADTFNTLTDADTYIYPSVDVDEPNAALFSKADLDITGLGVLTVNGRFNDAINCKDGLDIMGGTIVATGVDDGIRGKDNVSITGGSVTVTATNNGIKSDNDSDAGRGFINIESGTVNVTSGGDAITAFSTLTVNGGDVTIVSGGGSSRTVASQESAKGLKAGTQVLVTGGTINLDCADDAVHSNNSIVVDGGTILAASGDDAFHGEETLEINDGDITVTKSYEGIESKLITINDGTIHITSRDDGVNVAGGDGSGGWNPGGSSSNYFLYINGGYLWMNAGGDGLDSNGNIVMTGGTVLVNGPSDNGNGAVDTGDGGSYYFKISGGFLVAAGSSGMAVGNSSSSTQYGVLVNLSSSQSAGTTFHLRTAAGVELLTFKPAKKYQSVLFSSPDLGTGSHEAYLGGSSSGSLTDNLYSGGQYTPGTRYTTFTVSSTATRVGGGGGPGFQPAP